MYLDPVSRSSVEYHWGDACVGKIHARLVCRALVHTHRCVC